VNCVRAWKRNNPVPAPRKKKQTPKGKGGTGEFNHDQRKKLLLRALETEKKGPPRKKGAFWCGWGERKLGAIATF